MRAAAHRTPSRPETEAATVAPAIDWLASLPAEARNDWIGKRSLADAKRFAYGWRGIRARAEQLAPEGPWKLFAIVAGRGFGKTRSGAEWVREQWKAGKRRMGMVGATVDDVRDIMVEGPSGICTIGPPDERPEYQMHRRRVVWPDGAEAYLFSADAPERIRGREFEAAWLDEVGSWRSEQSRSRELRGALGKTRGEDSYNNVLFCMRRSTQPQICVTTTPRPLPLVRRIMNEADYVSRGTSHDNAANLSGTYFDIIGTFEGTRIGRQEIGGELIEDVDGALWNVGLIEEGRLHDAPEVFDRIVVGVDPPGEAAECGIVIIGHVSGARRSYVIGDRSMAGSPNQWAAAVIRAFDEFRADLVVVEVNFGGPMVVQNLRNVRPQLPIKQVRASRGKAPRAEPISTLYETGVIRHAGTFPLLEDQLCGWVPGMKSPDRLDALVWAATELHGKTFGPLVW